MGPFSRAEAGREISEVNVVPLADVSLVLLIILLVLSPMMRQNMLHVKTAAQSTKPEPLLHEELLEAPKPPELVLVVGLNPDGFVVGAQRFADEASLISFLKSDLAARADKKVFLSPHQDVSVGLIVNALEAIKGCGADSVALVQTQEENPHGQIRAAAPTP